MAKAYHVTSLEVCRDGMERLRSQSEWILVAYGSGPNDGEAVKAAWRDESLYFPESWDSEAALAALESWWSEGGEGYLRRELELVPWDEWRPDTEEGESIPCKLYIRESSNED